MILDFYFFPVTGFVKERTFFRIHLNFLTEENLIECYLTKLLGFMNVYCKIIFILTLFSLDLSAQKGLYLTTNIGVGANSKFILNNKDVRKSTALFTELKASYQFGLYQKIYWEVGLGGRAIAARGELDGMVFKAKTLRIILPVHVGTKITEKLDVAIGVTGQNNEDIDGILLRSKYFWRMSGSIRGKYALTNRWYAYTELSHSLRGARNSYLVNDPKTALFIGISFLLR